MPAKLSPDAGKKHNFFKTVIILNLAADVFMSIYSAVHSQSIAITLGMAMLALCFLAAVPGMLLLRVEMRASSCAIAGAAVCILNAAIGTVFAGEFFGVFGQGMLMPAEGIAAGVIAADILIFVNLLVKRKIDGDL